MFFVEKVKFFVPPSALKPYATAIASRSVDLPVPFSPTKKVTGGFELYTASGKVSDYRQIVKI